MIADAESKRRSVRKMRLVVKVRSTDLASMLTQHTSIAGKTTAFWLCPFIAIIPQRFDVRQLQRHPKSPSCLFLILTIASISRHEDRGTCRTCTDEWSIPKAISEA